MNVGIIGGGIGGLALAIALAKRGFAVCVHEKASKPRSVGAGIVLSFNGFEVMKRLGLGDATLRSGKPLNVACLADKTFRPLSRIDATALAERLQSAMVALERGTLHRLLLEALGTQHISWGDECARIDEMATHARVSFRNGSQKQYDLVIGADGLHSTVRHQIFPTHHPRYAGQTSWRAVASCRIDPAWRGCNWEALGEGKRFGMVELPYDKVYWYAVMKAPQGGSDGTDDVQAKLKDAFKGFHPIVQDVLSQTPPATILRTDISDLAPMPSWHKGRVALLGDAAHATTPNLGQGGNQALEDAWCLASLLAKGQALDVTLRHYEELRMKKAHGIVRASRFIGWLFHVEQQPFARLRDALLRMAPPDAQLQRLERLAALATD